MPLLNELLFHIRNFLAIQHLKLCSRWAHGAELPQYSLQQPGVTSPLCWCVMYLWISNQPQNSELQYKSIISIAWDFWKLNFQNLLCSLAPHSNPNITEININTVKRIHSSHHLEMPISSTISHERGILWPSNSSMLLHFHHTMIWNCMLIICIYKIRPLTRKVTYSNLSFYFWPFFLLLRG